MWHSLIANFSVVGLFIFGWLQSQELLGKVRRRSRRLLFGLVMGVGAIASMLLSVELQPGLYFDLRATFLALSAFIGGPFAGLVTASMTAIYRLSLGGVGTLGAMAGIVSVLIVGLSAKAVIRQRTPSFVEIVLFSSVASCVQLLSFGFLPDAAREAAFENAGLPVVVLGFVALVVALVAVAQSRHHVEERKLLLAAFQHAPDFVFVKDRDSRFVAVNERVAEVNGYASVASIRGLTDFDLSPERAGRLFAGEQQIMESGLHALNVEEKVTDAVGKQRWYLTSKAPVHNVDGEVIGLSGVTRDITERKQLEKALVDSRNELKQVLTEISDGLARFDHLGRLMFCNTRYQAMFPLTGSMRVSGANLSDILLAAVGLGEQLDIPADKIDRWIASVMAAMAQGGEEEVRLFNGRWLHVRTTPLGDGGATVLVSDITKLKQAEMGLLVMTEHLKILADTDGLTGILNRRSFDAQLQKEVARTRRSGQPLSLIMVDIDRFKTFNDLYGHPAGDSCIKQVVAVLKAGARRSGDVVARYGGEEMALILPDTDELGAYEVAESMRQAVQALSIANKGSEKGVVTISLGVATFAPVEEAPAAILVDRADEALYIAKEAGRNRVMGWSARFGHRAAS